VQARFILMCALSVAALVAPVSTARSGEVSFARKPLTKKLAEEKYEISFAVSGKADVEVCILDGKGNPVRHLAAGVLGGKNPPPAPLKPGLSQELTWNLSDDFGRPAKGAPFKVRVRAGMGFKLGRFIGEDPHRQGTVESVACDEDGRLYVLGDRAPGMQNMKTLRVFDQQGRYLRTVMPFPADLPPDSMKDVARWDNTSRAFRPRNLRALNPEFYKSQRSMKSGGNLHLLLVSVKKGIVLTDGACLYRLTVKGSVPGKSFLWKKLGSYPGTARNGSGGPVHVAVSPDLKYAYLSGPWSAKTRYGHKYDPKWPPGRIYRLELESGEGGWKPFVTIPVAHKEGVGGAWATKRQCPTHYSQKHGPLHGLAIDAKGRIYLADRENDRVAVFDAAGKPVGSIAIKYPDLISVHSKTGAVYVLTKDCVGYGRYQNALVKFPGFAKGVRPKAEYKFTGRGLSWASMAVSANGKKTVVWINKRPIEDLGGKLHPVELKSDTAAGNMPTGFTRIAVDYSRDEVYVSDGGNRMWRYDGIKGNGTAVKLKINDLSVGYDGLLYVRVSGKFGAPAYSGPLERLTRDFKPAPYPKTGSHILNKFIYGMKGVGMPERGIGVGADGKVYVASMYGWAKSAVTGYGPDGRPLPGKYLKAEIRRRKPKDGKTVSIQPKGLDGAIIGPIPLGNGGLRVDLRGNIYLGMSHAWPKGAARPPQFSKDHAYRHTSGSVLKFPPQGGYIAFTNIKKRMTKAQTGYISGFGETPRMPRPAGASGIQLEENRFAVGAVKAYTGIGPYSSYSPKLGEGGCSCRIPRFDIDRYGRLGLPNAVAGWITIVDNNGNQIARIGKYGNFDSQFVNANTAAGKAGKPTVATPDIPLAWPTGVGFSEKHMYVLDSYNRRVVRLDVTHSLEETCVLR
jgi:NHL repeat